MITFEDLVKIPEWEMKSAIQFGIEYPELNHTNPMTGILKSAGKWIVENFFRIENAEPLMLRLQTFQVLGRQIYVPTAFIRGDRRVVVLYVHMPRSRLATSDSIKGITAAGWATSRTLRLLKTPGSSMICAKNDNVLNPINSIFKEEPKCEKRALNV